MNDVLLLKSKGIPMPRIAEISGFELNTIRNMALSGALGVQQLSSSDAVLDLWQISHVFAFREAAKARISNQRVNGALGCFAAAIYVRFALSELKQGRWQVSRGSPDRFARLLNRCNSEEGRDLIEQQLPLAGKRTRRFSCFSDDSVRTCDSLHELHELQDEWPLTILDSWAVARRIQHSLPGTHFTADIGLAA